MSVLPPKSDQPAWHQRLGDGLVDPLTDLGAFVINCLLQNWFGGHLLKVSFLFGFLGVNIS